MTSSKNNNAKCAGIDTKPTQKFSPRLRQLFLAVGPVIIYVCFGIAEGFSAILLPQLEEQDDIPIDENIGSWIASITALPMSLGCILGGWLMEVIGRRGIHLTTCVPTLISWMMIYFSREIVLLLVGRFISGLCIGLIGPSSAVYFAEMTDPKFRGFLLGTLNTAMTLGIMLAHIMGTFLSWRTVALISCSPPALCFVLMLFVPESAAYLAKKNKMEEAEKAFYWVRGYGPEAQIELDEIIKRQHIHRTQPRQNLKKYIDSLKKPEFYKPLLILGLFFTVMQWSGHNGIAFYSVTIAKEALGGTVDEYLATIVIDMVRIAGAVGSCFVLKVVTRRMNLLFSGVSASICLIVLGVFVHFSNIYPSLTSDYPAVPLTAFAGSMALLSIGVIPLPWTMSGELFPLANRGFGSGVVSTYNCLVMFLVVKATPFIFSGFGTGGAFLLFGAVVLTGTAFLMLVLPETRGVALHNIEDGFKKRVPESQ